MLLPSFVAASLASLLFVSLSTAAVLKDHALVDRCILVKHIVDTLKLFKATPLCYSYLSIHTQTKTSSVVTVKTTTVQKVVSATITDSKTFSAVTTSYASTVIDQPVTTVQLSVETDTVTTIYVTEAVTSTTTTIVVPVTSITTIPSTVTVTTPSTTFTSYTVPPQTIQGRSIQERNAPCPVERLFARSLISSGCRCLSLPTPTTTIFRTSTSYKTATATSSALVTVIASVFKTSTVIVTVTSTHITTITSVSVSTDDVSATITTTSTDDVAGTVTSQVVVTQPPQTTTVPGPATTITIAYPDQVVQDFSFEQGRYQPLTTPWSYTAGQFDTVEPQDTRCTLASCSSLGREWLDIEFECLLTPTVTVIRQQLYGVEVGHPYTLSMWVGNLGETYLQNSIQFSASVGSVAAFPKQYNCNPQSDCQPYNTGNVGGIRNVNMVITPAEANPVLTINVYPNCPTDGHTDVYDALFDLVTLTRN
ncbi:hypothetical protein TWF694_005431 [Orbilia ellipsospora]|uniref:Uncharacterized protein n=1 Tax=Orbilia ellipsospora TaxID=2528407 RepID=A0AAV9WUA5_9PEZI